MPKEDSGKCRIFGNRGSKTSVKFGSKSGPCTGKKFIVTGGARGIGKAVVEELHAQGATVYALARSPDSLKALQKELPSVKTICVDLGDWNATKKELEKIEPVDCLINNAGIYVSQNFMDTKPEDLDRQFDTNLKAVVNVSQVVAAKMVKAGNGGAIVNISSASGKKVFADSIAYGSLKSGLEMMTKGMALELAPHKITVNAVCPAAVETDLIRQAINGTDEAAKSARAQLELMQKKTPTGSAFMPINDVVNAILFFGAGVASQVTGETLLVDGGLRISF